MMTTLYGVYQYEGVCKVLKAAFASEAEAQEMLMDLFFERSYEAFCYYMSQEDVYWYCGGEKWRNTKSEVEVALECARDPEGDFFIEEFPAFIPKVVYCEDCACSRPTTAQFLRKDFVHCDYYRTDMPRKHYCKHGEE
jgi:hypothetical protein